MERDLVRWLRSRLPQRDNILVGLGDDAAVLRAERNLVVTTDMLMDGVDFILSDIDPRRVGRKALAVNLSDLAAMAAKPIAAFVSLCLPRNGGETLAKQLYEGMLPLADDFACSIAGGDTNSWDGPLVINVTAIGETTAGGPLLRSGARSGDAIMATGAFGNSLAGHHLDFTPRVLEALQLARSYEIHAGMDVSDGLSLDLFRMCEESRCGAVLDAGQIPRRDDCPLENALADGEDFELLLAVPAAVARQLVRDQPLGNTRLSILGEFIATPSLILRSPDGNVRPLTPRGFEHRLEG